jgi:CDP-4-dehydro-6-deoxyglucose reductase, E1
LDHCLPTEKSFYSTTQGTGHQQAKKVWYAPHTFQAYGEEEIEAVVRCLRKGWLAPGPIMAEFEAEVAAYFGKKHGVMVNSGSSANTIGLAVLDLAGKEVITPACTFSTCIAPMEQLGIKPVFVDVEIGRYVPSVDAILAAITPNTACIFIPNLVGSKPDWDDLRARLPRQDIVLFEDSCDTMTYTASTDISVISFYASHIITAGGCGGVVMFNDPKLASKALMYRDWGRIGNNSEDMAERFGHSVDGIPYDFKFLYGVLGYNFKCSEMNAAFGLEQMKKLPNFTKIRADNIDRYVSNLKKAGTSYILPVDHDKYDWLALPLMIQKRPRMDLLKYLEDNEVQVRARGNTKSVNAAVCCIFRLCFNSCVFTCSGTRVLRREYHQAPRVQALLARVPEL